MRRALFASLSAVALLASGLAVHTASSAPVCPSSAGKPGVSDHRLRSFDGTPIALTVFRPPGVCPARPAPAILSTHGWAGHRATALTLTQEHDPTAPGDERVRAATIRRLLEGGYGVISIDARGHGDSGGEGFALHPDVEVRDFRAVIDWTHDTQRWVKRDKGGLAKDVRVGAIGGSYAGAFQLMTAAFDKRLDAIVPIVTWNDLPHTLAPNAAINEAWRGVLSYVSGSGRPLARGLRDRVDETLRTGRVHPELAASLAASSPRAWADRVRTPTMIVQGMRDPLVPVNEAARTFVALRAAGTPAWLWTLNGAHEVPALLSADTGGTDPCRTPVRDFFATYLRDDAAARRRLEGLPRVGLATDEGACVRTDTWPPVGPMVGTQVRGLSLGSGRDIVLPVHRSSADELIAGVPRAHAWTRGSPGEVLSIALVVTRGDRTWTLSDQETLLRTREDAPSGRYDLELAGVASHLRPDDLLSVRLRLVTPALRPMEVGMSLELPIA